MWALLILLGWVALELIMARLAAESGPEIHSITRLDLSAPSTEPETTANGQPPMAKS